jgi:precorrin-6B C5,15-methyltransferase / cobalt-precorrin-6B C5,C15-methyltransferase
MGEVRSPKSKVRSLAGTGLCPSPVIVLGVGDDGADGLPASALGEIERADVLCGGERHLAFFPDHPAERVVLKGGIDGALARIEEAQARGLRVVVLASGDPGFFGIGKALAGRLGRDAIRTLPGVSSVALAFARLGEPWQDAVTLSAHGRPLESILGPACAAARFAVLTDERNTPGAIARALLDCGMEDADAAVGEHLGSARERVARAPLSQIAVQEFAALNVLVVLRDPADVRWGCPFVGLPDEAYRHERGMITKAEVRAVTLSRLRPWDALVLWDIGAGSGSVAIECAAHMQRGTVYAVERDPSQLEHLRANVRGFQAGNVRVVAGEAPVALAALPEPDAAFIGGSGGGLEGILESTAMRLRAGGRVVLNLATLEHLSIAHAWLRQAGWSVDVAQIAVSRSSPVGDLTRMAALNPVFIVAGEKPS